MPTYTFTCKQKVTEYTRTDVEADSAEEALAKIEASPDDAYVWELYDSYVVDSEVEDEFKDQDGKKYSQIELMRKHDQRGED